MMASKSGKTPPDELFCVRRVCVAKHTYSPHFTLEYIIRAPRSYFLESSSNRCFALPAIYAWW